MYCQSCGSEVSGEFGFCPVCGSEFGPAVPEEEPEAETGSRFGMLSLAAVLSGLAAGFLISFILGWTFFVLVPILFFGTGAGGIRRVLTFLSIGMVSGMCIGFLLRIMHISLFRCWSGGRVPSSPDRDGA